MGNLDGPAVRRKTTIASFIESLKLLLFRNSPGPFAKRGPASTATSRLSLLCHGLRVCWSRISTRYVLRLQRAQLSLPASVTRLRMR
jgi:hypothetical protein